MQLHKKLIIYGISLCRICSNKNCSRLGLLHCTATSLEIKEFLLVK